MNEKICIKYEDKKAVIICVQPFQSMKHICCAVKNPKELHIHFFFIAWLCTAYHQTQTGMPPAPDLCEISSPM